MSKSLISCNDSLYIREATLKRLSSPSGKNKGGEYVSARTHRRAAAAETKRALKKQLKKETA